MLPVGRFALLLVVAVSQLAVCYRIALALKCCKLCSCICKKWLNFCKVDLTTAKPRTLSYSFCSRQQ